jgi:protein O-GlcNAc transferase
VGASLLGTVGFADLVAETEEGYVETVVNLARDLPRLVRLRRDMRHQMMASPLMEQQGFTEALEAEYWLMWKRFQDGSQAHGR